MKESGDTGARLRRPPSTSLQESAVLSSVVSSMYPGIELRTMRYIVAVGNELHFSRAAEHVHVAQPSLSKQIRHVEEELGVELFKRTRKKVEVTEPGRAFIENAEQALLYADRAASMARAASAGQHGRLLLGVAPNIDLQLFFRIKNAFEKRYANVQVQYVSGSANQHAEWVMRSDVHAGLIELPIRYRGLAVLAAFREPALLAVRRNDKLASAKSILLEELKDRTLVLLSETADLARDRILVGLQGWGYRPEKIINVISLVHAFDFVAAGEGIAVLHASASRFESRKIILRSVPELPMLDTGIAYRRDIRSPLVRNLLRVVREVFAEERSRMIEHRQKC
jgi:DNA-binding transcriptional LysR family regulator